MSQSSSRFFQPPPLAGDTGEEIVPDLEGIDSSQNFLELDFNRYRFPQEPTEDSQKLHGLSDGLESLSHFPPTCVPSLDTCYGASSVSLNFPFETENTQKKQSFAAPMPGRDPFLHQTFVLRTAFRKTPNPSDLEIRQLCFETGLEDYQVHNWFQGERDLWRNFMGSGPVTPEKNCSDVLQSRLYPDPNSDSFPEQHTEDSLFQGSHTNATGQGRELLFGNPRPRKRRERSQNTLSTLVAVKPRRSRTLTAEGRAHAKAIRECAGGACPECMRRKIKCTHKLPEDMALESHDEPTPKSPWTGTLNP